MHSNTVPYQNTESRALCELGRSRSPWPVSVEVLCPAVPKVREHVKGYLVEGEGRTCRLMTSSLVAGVLDTRCTHSCPSSVHSRGGSTLSRISSACWFFCASTGGSLDFGGLGIGPPPPTTATVGCWLCLERDWQRREKSEEQYIEVCAQYLVLPVRALADQYWIVVLHEGGCRRNHAHLGERLFGFRGNSRSAHA